MRINVGDIHKLFRNGTTKDVYRVDSWIGVIVDYKWLFHLKFQENGSNDQTQILGSAIFAPRNFFDVRYLLL